MSIISAIEDKFQGVRPSAKQHHYVPRWYQKRFLQKGQKRFKYYLDLFPDVIDLPGGGTRRHKDLHIKGPDSCFLAENLYTAEELGFKDEIERFLFNQIDGIGSQALPVIVSGEWQKARGRPIHGFMDYLSAQKLRTPKGLDWLRWICDDWIKAHNSNVLQFMILLKRMHITTWTECYWEIVSAESSDVKFIVSDHPVTMYNHAVSPIDPRNRYPSDPFIEQIGTRTIFAFDLNHCLILSNRQHVEYAEADPIQLRENPRMFGDSIFNIESIIRGRDLDDNQVAQINYILKLRAKRFIASAKPEWLYPEEILYRENIRWADIDRTLRPKKGSFSIPGDHFWGSGGQIKGIDPFGREITDQEELRKIQEMVERVRRTPPGSKRLVE